MECVGTVGDIGVQIVVSSGGYSLLGATCTLLAAPGSPIAPGSAPLSQPTALVFGPMTVSADGTTATYVRNGNDFTSGGTWNVQLQVAIGGEQLTSAPDSVYVNPLV